MLDHRGPCRLDCGNHAAIDGLAWGDAAFKRDAARVRWARSEATVERLVAKGFGTTKSKYRIFASFHNFASFPKQLPGFSERDGKIRLQSHVTLPYAKMGLGNMQVQVTVLARQLHQHGPIHQLPINLLWLQEPRCTRFWLGSCPCYSTRACRLEPSTKLWLFSMAWISLWVHASLSKKIYTVYG